MASRRNFIKTSSFGTASLFVPGVIPMTVNTIPLRLSLAQWSLHRTINEGVLNPIDFPQVAKENYGINAVEYVNQFYVEQGKNPKFWKDLRSKTDDLGVTNVLIMVDNEGLLGDPSAKNRITAVEQHIKWAEAAQILGCHAIRVNAFGTGSKEALKEQLSDGLSRLAKSTEPYGISVLVENHGLHSSDGRYMADLIAGVNHPGLGTLPDFGNWCMTVEWGSTQDGNCGENYGPEAGLAEFLPLAGGVSAKSYDFDSLGNETVLPYKSLLQRVKNSGYSGYIGIEYEGNRLSEEAGIRATKNLLESLWPTLD